MKEFHLYMAQRLSALIMAPFVIIHIGVMIYAIQDGLTAAEILGRTRGSLLWFTFYGMFVIAVSIHASLGLRTILGEWAGLRGAARDGAAALIGLGLFVLGAQAVWGVTYAIGPMGGPG
ncbi:MAG: succinate dehydrogenase [Pelagibaca sp.]